MLRNKIKEIKDKIYWHLPTMPPHKIIVLSMILNFIESISLMFIGYLLYVNFH